MNTTVLNLFFKTFKSYICNVSMSAYWNYSDLGHKNLENKITCLLFVAQNILESQIDANTM